MPFEKNKEPNTYSLYKVRVLDFVMCGDKMVYSKTLADNNCIVAIGNSTLTRALELQDKCKSADDICTDLITVTADVKRKDKKVAEETLHKIIISGFTLDGNKYIFFTASAGQIRTKEMMFILKSAYDKIIDKLTCGLSINDINANGGMIPNKYMAYMALTESTTKQWLQIKIKDCIVVNDFDNTVTDMVDHITLGTDKKGRPILDDEIKREKMPVPILQTDGCGMILPNKSKTAFTVRAPWIKGLLVPFDFAKFIRECNAREPGVNHALIEDAYGDEHDVLKEKIQIIFTKSQFKAFNYFSHWCEYQSNFDTYKCEFAKCKTQKETVREGRTNYQALQTLSDFAEDELESLVEATNKRLNALTHDPLTIWDAHKSTNQRQIWEAVTLYPELLQDSYTEQLIREEAKSFHDNALWGQLVIDGINTFLSPDLYAFCEHLFLYKENPTGLIAKGQVSCSLYGDGDKCDCLRSPHWSREHSIETNVINENTKEWFCKQVCFCSCDDLITKTLQADFDGDTALICRDKTLVTIAERNMRDTVPLYYEMPKGKKEHLNGEAFYNGMIAAYRYSIGHSANKITKLWNKPDISETDLNNIKLFTAASNFYTDYAKTLFAPKLPAAATEVAQHLEKRPFPYFWRYTKNFRKEKKAKEDGVKSYFYLGELISFYDSFSDTCFFPMHCLFRNYETTIYSMLDVAEFEQMCAAYCRIINDAEALEAKKKAKIETEAKAKIEAKELRNIEKAKKASAKAEKSENENDAESSTPASTDTSDKICDEVDYKDIKKSGIAGTPSTCLIDCIGEKLNDKEYATIDTSNTRMGAFDYKVLMCDPERPIDSETYDKIVAAYKSLAGKYKPKTKSETFNAKCIRFRKALAEVNPDEKLIIDSLIKYLFDERATEQTRKSLFWGSFGDQVVDNIKTNLAGTKVCNQCLGHFQSKKPQQLKCPECQSVKV